MVKSIHSSKDSLKKVCTLQIKFPEFDCLTEPGIRFYFSYLKLIPILLFETNFVFVICSYVIWYVIINHGTSLYRLQIPD